MKFYSLLSKIDRADYVINYEFDLLKIFNSLDELDSYEENEKFELYSEKLAFSIYEEPNDNHENFYNLSLLSELSNDLLLRHLAYWEKRFNNTENTILKTRYSGLLIEVKNYFFQKKADIKIFQSHIDCICEIAEKHLLEETYGIFQKLIRAINFSILYNYSKDRCASVLIEFENKYKEDFSPGLWGYSFEHLLTNKSIKLSEDQKVNIIESLEKIYENVCSPIEEYNRIDVRPATFAAEKLLKFYQNKEIEKFNIVIRKLKTLYYSVYPLVRSLHASALSEDLAKLFLNFKLHDEYNNELINLQLLSTENLKELQKIDFGFSHSKIEIEKYLSYIFGGDVSEFIRLFISHNIESEYEIITHLENHKKKNFWYYMGSKLILNQKGITIKVIHPTPHISKDLIYKEINSRMSLGSYLLNIVISEAIKKFNLCTDFILYLINRVDFIEKNRIEIFRKAFDAYFKSDHIIFLHLLIPQIEEAIRNYFQSIGGNILIANNDSYKYLTLHPILNNTIMEEKLGTDFINYFKVLFVDPIGWNVRNEIAHGFRNSAFYSQEKSDRVFHAFITLLHI